MFVAFDGPPRKDIPTVTPRSVVKAGEAKETLSLVSVRFLLF